MQFKGLEEFFSYTKAQRRGIYVLLLLATAMLAGLYFDDYFYSEVTYDKARFEEIKRQIENQKAQNKQLVSQNLKPFNPNKTPKATWVAMGFSGSLADRIERYLAKGGNFKKPADLYKIYGIDSALVQEVLPYVVLPVGDEKPSGEDPNKKDPILQLAEFDPNTVAPKTLEAMGLKSWQAQNFVNFRTKYRPFKAPSDVYKVYGVDSGLAQKLLPFVKIEAVADTSATAKKVLVNLNTADSLELIKVRGIAAFTASKILALRNKLGGFYSVSQLKGQYPVNEERYTKIEDQLYCKGPVKKLNLNTASFKELVSHPYLSYDMVKGIVSFRENIRPFEAVTELENIELFNKEIMSKIAPYLEVR